MARFASMTLEKLHFALVLYGFLTSPKRAQIATFSGLGIPLSRIEPVFAGFQFPNH